MEPLTPTSTETAPLKGSIGIVGGGAVGGWLAARMQQASWAVTLLCRPGSGNRTVSRFHVTGPDHGEIKAEVPCEETDRNGSSFDWLFVTVKAGDLATVAQQIHGRINEETRLVFPGNGIDSWVPFQGCGSDRFFVAATTYGLLRRTAEEISVRGDGGEITLAPVGEFDTDRSQTRLLAEALSGLGLKTLLADDGREVVWKKNILSAGLNPVCALLGIENGQLPASPGFALATAASTEAQAVAMAEGFDLPKNSVAEALTELCEKTARNRCSMLQDLDAGMGTEVDAISGAIVRRGQELRVPTPANRLLLNLVSGETLNTCLKTTVN